MGVIPVKACRELPGRLPNVSENPTPSNSLQSRRKRPVQTAREETDPCNHNLRVGGSIPSPATNPFNELDLQLSHVPTACQHQISTRRESSLSSVGVRS
jgi:hypothetical protein